MPLDPDPVSDDPCRFLQLLRENGSLTNAERTRGQMNWSELWAWMKERDVKEHEIWARYGSGPRDKEDEDGSTDAG